MPALETIAFIRTAVGNMDMAAMAPLDPVEPRVWVMSMIFGISLFAVAFPGVSKQVAFLRIPHILFFIGKHFGTGVILATAFIHLLCDAFESLQKPIVKEEYHNIGKWTGLIILGSLLAIFLIEYTSTTYVDLLQAHPSPPSTPSNSRPTSPSPRTPSPASLTARVSHALESSKDSANGKGVQLVPAAVVPTSSAVADLNVTERTPLIRLPSGNTTSTTTVTPTHVSPSRTAEGTAPSRPQLTHVAATTPARPQRARSLPRGGAPYHHYSPHNYGHHHPSYIHHHAHPHIPPVAALVPIDILTNSPRLIRTGQGVCVCPAKEGRERGRTRERAGDEEVRSEAGESEEAEEERRQGKLRIGRRRQVIGILVLQLGIMIHSLVIGLTLSIANGADFTSLTTAIIFHQLFEGLSLGIRIAALPGSRPTSTSHSHPPTPSSSSSQTYGTVTQPGCKPSCENEYADKKWWHWRSWAWTQKTEFNWLKFTLSILFAVTTPLGMGVGMLTFQSNGQDKVGMAHMYLVQGLMSAISAGMLIYAATVEMIAGDFVFGDVEGHSHGHGHGHGHEGEDDVEEGAVEEHDETGKKGKVQKKILAVVSLLAGVGGMVLVGLVE